jgi:hypothetical protein
LVSGTIGASRTSGSIGACGPDDSSARVSELACTVPRTRSGLKSSVTSNRVWPDVTQRSSAVWTSSETSTVTTAGIGVITCRACCSCRWKTPWSIPASPGSRWPPVCARAISTRSDPGVWPSSMAVSGLMRTRRRMPFEVQFKAAMNGRIPRLNQFSGRATRLATPSAWTIANTLGTCSPAVI